MRAGRGILPFRLVRENDYYEFKPVMNSPEGWKSATATILDNGIGNRLLEFVYALSPNKPFVHFEVILDKDGNPEMSYIGMNYGERGKIGYTQAALINEYKDELLCIPVCR